MYESYHGVRLPRRRAGETEDEHVARVSEAMRRHGVRTAWVVVPFCVALIAVVAWAVVRF